MAKPRKSNRLGEAILEMSEDLRRCGMMDEATFLKIEVRHLGQTATITAMPIGVPAVKTPLEHFSHCWASRERLAVAFSFRKTPIRVEALLYTHGRNALVRAKKLAS